VVFVTAGIASNVAQRFAVHSWLPKFQAYCQNMFNHVYTAFVCAACAAFLTLFYYIFFLPYVNSYCAGGSSFTLVFGKSLVRISVRPPALLSQVFRHFSQSVSQNAPIRWRPHLFRSFLVHCSAFVLSFDPRECRY
jgi:hypothetical protein